MGRLIPSTLGIVTIVSLVASCGGGSPGSPSQQNRAPSINAVDVTPPIAGFHSAAFSFQAAGADPDGDVLTYSWQSSDGGSSTGATSSFVHAFTAVGTFEIRLTVTDPQGASATSTVSVRVGTVTGVWDLTCVRSALTLAEFPRFPTQFVVTLRQAGKAVTGSLAAAGRARDFTVPGEVSTPRRVTFGVEGGDNIWAQQDGDMYFGLEADSTLNSTVSWGHNSYCSSYVAVRR